MYRQVMTQLKQWQRRPERKPLILRGARQVGKTYLLRHFGQEHYTSVAYINFEDNPDWSAIFAGTLEPRQLLKSLGLRLGQAILPSDTLLVLDEIQECPRALTALKYFCEQAPEYHVAAAGSLLGVGDTRASFPVGKVEFLDVYPMTFSEFARADGLDLPPQLDNNFSWPTSGPLLDTQRWHELLRDYLIVGGMPEVVSSWVKRHDITAVDQLQSAILRTYELDFSKHVDTPAQGQRVRQVWQSLVSQLARENKKFIYQTIKTGARAREYELALEWLRQAGLIYKVYSVTHPGFPLRMFDDLGAFKVYLLDVGLLRQLAGITSSELMDPDSAFQALKGAVAENYVIQALTAAGLQTIRYYTFERYEIDFLLQLAGQVVPVEVKSGASKQHASLTNYVHKYEPALALRFSSLGLDRSGYLLNIPLYLADFVLPIVRDYTQMMCNLV